MKLKRITRLPAQCLNDDKTGLDGISGDLSNMEVKNEDGNSEELNDDSLPASPSRVTIIDFNTTLPCSPDPQNPMLRNLVNSSFCSGSSSDRFFDSSSNRTINSSNNRTRSRTIHSFSDRTIGMSNSSMDSSRNSDIDSFSNKSIVNSCGNELTDQTPSISVSHRNFANAVEEASKVNQTQSDEQGNMTIHEIGGEIRKDLYQKSFTESISGKNSKEETKNMCNQMLIDSLQDIGDSVTFLESGLCMMSQPVDCAQNSSKANSAHYLNNIDMNIKDTTDTNEACETRTECTGNEEAVQKTVAVLKDGCSQIDLVEQDSENCFGLGSKQGENHATDGNDHKSESEYFVHNSLNEINEVFRNNGGLQFTFNQTEDASLTQANEVMENFSTERNQDQSIDFPYCSCDETQEGSDVPIEQIFVNEGQMYQLSHANIVRVGNLEFYAFLRDDSLHIPLGYILRVVDSEVASIFQSAVKFEGHQLPCLTPDETYLLEQKCGVCYDSTNISLISLVTLREICMLLLNIYPDSMTLKMLAFSKPCQRILGSQLRCSVCGLSKNSKHLDKTYIPVNQTGDHNPKVEATVGTLTIGDKDFSSFELKGEVYMSLKNVFQQKVVTLKTLQLRLKKLNSKTIIAPMEIEEYFRMQGTDVDHTLWIDMVTLRCLICMSQLSTPELIRIAQGEFMYKPSYHFLCEDTSRSDTCFVANSFGELIQNNNFKGMRKGLPFILIKGGHSMAERIKDDSISGNENIDTVIDDSGLINGPKRKYSKSIQTGTLDKNSYRPRNSCRPTKKKKSSDMFYFFDKNENFLEYNRENQNDQKECKDGVRKHYQFRKKSSGCMKNLSQVSESDGKVILKPGDYIVRNYEKFYEKLDAGYIVGKGNDNKLVHLQSEEKLAASALESAKGIDVFTGIWKENKDTHFDQVQQFSGRGYKQGSNLDLNYFKTKESAKTDNTDVILLEAENNSAFDEENKAKDCDDMSSENQGSLNNDLNQAVAMSNPSSEDLQNFIDRFSTLDSDIVKNVKFSDASLTPNKSKLKISAVSVTDCIEEGINFSSVQQFKKGQINEVEKEDNCIQFVTGNNCIIPESITEELFTAEEKRKHPVTIKEPVIKVNNCVQKEGNDIRRFESDLHERSVANMEDKVLLRSVESAQVTETESEKPDDIEVIGHRQCKQDIIEQSEQVAVTQEKMEDVCNGEEEKGPTLEYRTQENMQNPAQNVRLEEKCEVEMAEIQPEQNIDADGRIGKTVEDLHREMEDNIRKYLVFMYVKEGNQTGFRVKKFKEGAEQVFPALFFPDPEHLETKLKRMKFMKAAAKYMDGLFHHHTQKLLEKKMKMSETSSTGRSATVKDICESSSQSTCSKNTVKTMSDKFVEDKHEKVADLPDSNIKYSAKSVSRCDRKLRSRNRRSITSTQEQETFKKLRLDNVVSLVEINELETVEGRLTRARKRLISNKSKHE